MKTIKNLVLAAASIFVIFGSLSTLAFAADCSGGSAKDALQCGSNNAAGQSGSANAEDSLNTTVKNVVNVMSVIVGVVAVIMIIVAGLRYIASGGNEQSIAAAKRTILYAIIGLLIAVLAQVIARFVLHATTKK